MTRTVESVVVRLGPSVTLIRGDCLECLPIEADAVISDPPYGIDWDTDYRRFTTGFDVPRTNHKPVTNDAKPFDPTPWLGFKTVVLFGATCYAARLPLGSWLVWDKRFANGKAFLADGEAAWMNRGHGLYIYSETAQGFVRKEPIEHPTQKPVGVMAWCMDKAKVPEGATVLDPYMGSGTTGIACIRTGRKFIGIEIDAGHFETARKAHGGGVVARHIRLRRRCGSTYAQPQGQPRRRRRKIMSKVRSERKPKAKPQARRRRLDRFVRQDADFLAEQIDAVATLMWALAERMEYFAGFNGEMVKHSREMAGASVIARKWATAIRKPNNASPYK